jgi:hypothetical protein
MQTFVPYADFQKSAFVLDNKRLNKQLLEGRQIYQILASGKTKGAWVNHPAVKMWKNFDNALFYYLEAIKDECVERGIQTEKNWNVIVDTHSWNYFRGNKFLLPAWWNDERVHLSHRQNLFHKDPSWYGDFAYDCNLDKSHCCDRCNYFWPTHIIAYNANVDAT